MLNVLKSLTALKGVKAAICFSQEGGIKGHNFTQEFDREHIRAVIDLIVDSNQTLSNITGESQYYDIRYSYGRILIKPFKGYYLLLLCETNVNVPYLLISLKVCVGKLEALAPQQADEADVFKAAETVGQQESASAELVARQAKWQEQLKDYSMYFCE